VHSSFARTGSRLSALALTLLVSLAAAAPSTRIAMLIHAGKAAAPPLDAKSVLFDHASIGHVVLGGPKLTRVVEFTIELAASATAQRTFKPKSKLAKVDLLLYVTDAAGHQHFRSQVEIGNALVGEYTLSEDKKTATVKLSATAVYLAEPSPSTDKDWVSS
jgi:hypothetical protein